MTFARLGEPGAEIPVVQIGGVAYDLRPVTDDIDGAFLSSGGMARAVALATSGTLRKRREARARAEIESVALAELRRQLLAVRGDRSLPELARRVAAGELDAFTAATTWTGQAS